MAWPEFTAPPFDAALQAFLLALNNAHGEELSYKTEESFRELIAVASNVMAEAQGLGLLVAMNEAAAYDNPNFRWLKARYERFLYIDRVVVDAKARGQGLAAALYARLAAIAREEGRERLVCEINLDPPNPGSDAFHARLGFEPIGQQELSGGKTVRYWAMEL